MIAGRRGGPTDGDRPKPTHRDSSRQHQLDLQAGNPLELDDLLGAVVPQGHAKHVPVPAVAALYTALWTSSAQAHGHVRT